MEREKEFSYVNNEDEDFIDNVVVVQNFKDRIDELC